VQVEKKKRSNVVKGEDGNRRKSKKYSKKEGRVKQMGKFTILEIFVEQHLFRGLIYNRN
jgi:hypothetical protein